MKRYRSIIDIIFFWMLLPVSIFLIMIGSKGITEEVKIEKVLMLAYVGAILVGIFIFLCKYQAAKNSYVEIGKGKIVISRIVREFRKDNWRPKGFLKKKKSEINVSDITKIGYSADICGEYLEFNGFTTGYYATMVYSNGEAVIELKGGEKVPFIVATYSKKELKEILQYIYDETGIIPEGKLKDDIKIFK